MSALPGMVQQMVQQTMQAQGQAAGPAGPNGKPAKPDINTVAMDVFQLKKMFLHFMKLQGIDLPPDVLDGPNRDPSTGMPMPMGQGSSDPSQSAGGPGPSGGAGPQSAIQPISPMQGAFPSPPGGGGGTKAGADQFGAKVGEEVPSGTQLMSKAAAVARICRQRLAAKAGT
jgi:hypothetical protein